MEGLYEIIPEGVEDLFYLDYEKKEFAIKKVKDIFKSYGYRSISTPSFEYYDLFYNMDIITDRDEMFKIIDENGKILVLRPDMTIPIARIAALNFKNNTLKLSYVSNVYRRNVKGIGYLKKEFTQAGIEYFGRVDADSDAEVMAVGIKSLIKCGINDITVEIGHVGFIKGLLYTNILSKALYEKIRKSIETKNYYELEKLLNECDIPSDYKKVLLSIINLYGKPEEVILKAEKLILNKEMENSINNLNKIYEVLKHYGYEKFISFDLGLINHMNYYTGAVFKMYVNSHRKEVISGGRYDTLTQKFGRYIPATGFGLNIDEIMEVISMDNNIFKTDYILVYNDETRDDAINLASKLRDNDFIVETEFEEEKDIVKNRQAKEIVYILKDKFKVNNMENGAVYICNEDKFIEHALSKNVITPIH